MASARNRGRGRAGAASGTGHGQRDERGAGQLRLGPDVRTFTTLVAELSRATTATEAWRIVSRGARDLAGADGASLILADGDQCHYVDEDAVSPLWRGRQFPKSICVSGWVIDHAEPAIIPDIRHDDRVPEDVYEPTFVRSLLVVPIRRDQPLGAIGVYWADVHDADDADVALLSALADVTADTFERLRLLDELDRRVAARTADLERANLALEHFASVASHDLRGPLATINGLLATVLERRTEPLGETDERLVRRAHAQSASLLDTIAALLGLARINAAPIELADVDLAALVRDVAASLDDDLATADYTLRVDDLPDVDGDAPLLRVLFQNLLSNAIKFRAEERSLVITVTAQPTARGWRIAVADNGRGIPDDEREHIFDAFGRTRTESAPSGTGHGLATARRISERHGGTIEAEFPDVGARFVVELPRRPNSSIVSGQDPPSSPSSS